MVLLTAFIDDLMKWTCINRIIPSFCDLYANKFDTLIKSCKYVSFHLNSQLEHNF